MNSNSQRRRRIRLGCILAILPPLLAAGCCILLARPRDPGKVVEAARQFQSEWQSRFQGLNEDQVEAVAVEVVGGSVQFGLVLGKIQTDRDAAGLTLFDADLGNFGEYPVVRPRVVLRLKDEQGRLVETVTLTGQSATLGPGMAERVHGEFDPKGTPPRIVEEKLTIVSDSFLPIWRYWYDDVRLAPSPLSRIADVLPLVSYEALWTNPMEPWRSYEIEFRVEDILQG